MQVKIGVCSWRYLASHFDPGSARSRAMPKPSRIVDVWIDRQHTKIAADTTSRKTVENAFPKFASMMFAGPNGP